jgi:ABC-type antimicrobial peptide transport system permease subunit
MAHADERSMKRKLACDLPPRYQWLAEVHMLDETNDGGFDLMRVIINLAAIGLGVGIVALVVATIISGT